MRAIQLRMARAAVGWGVRELAKKAGVTANTVTRIENGADAKQSTMDKLRSALEAAGVEFTNGDQPGVRLTKAAEGLDGRYYLPAPARQDRRWPRKQSAAKPVRRPRRNDRDGADEHDRNATSTCAISASVGIPFSIRGPVSARQVRFQIRNAAHSLR